MALVLKHRRATQNNRYRVLQTVAADAHGNDDALCPGKAHETLDFRFARAEFAVVAKFR